MDDIKYEVGDVISTYVYREEAPTELKGTYEYNTGSILLFGSSLVVIGVIVGYWLSKKKK